MKSDSKNDVRKPSNLVYLAVLSAQMSSISLGCTLGWSGPALADMADRNTSEPHLTEDDKDIETWIGSSVTIGALLGGLLCGFCIELIGRKKTLIFLGIPYCTGWVLLCFSRSPFPIIVGRMITGLCCGIVLGVVPTYITEVSTPNIRGLLGMSINLFVVLGFLYVDVLCLFLNWNYLSLACIVPSILLSTSMIFMPESPNWLMNKLGRTLGVVEALHKLRAKGSDIDKELDELEERANMRKRETGVSFRQITRQDVYKPLLIGMCLMFFQQFSGMNALQFYLTGIFEDSGSQMKPEYAVIVVNASMLVATVFGGLLIDRLGRKVLLIVSGFGHMISIGVLGYYYFHTRDDTPTSSIIPILCLVVFVSSFSIGYGPIPWIIVTEITSSSAIGFISSTSSVFAWIWTFIVTKEFDDMQKIAQKYGAFWIFSGISALSIAFAIYLPETKGKSVEEIQRIYYPKVAAVQHEPKKPVSTL